MWIFIIGVFALLPTIAQQTKIQLQAGAGAIPMNTTTLGPKYSLGMHGGLQVQQQLKNKLWLSSGLYLSQKQQFTQKIETESYIKTLENFLLLAGSGDFPIDSLVNSLGLNLDAKNTTKEMIQLVNLEIPIMATYMHDKWSFHAGGYAGLLLGAKRKVETTTEVPFLQVLDIGAFDSTGLLQFLLPPAESTSTVESNSTDNLLRYDAGMLLGMGYQDDRWSFNIHYAHGFVDFRKSYTEAKQVNRAVRVMVGYVINVRKEESKIILE